MRIKEQLACISFPSQARDESLGIREEDGLDNGRKDDTDHSKHWVNVQIVHLGGIHRWNKVG